MPYNPDDDETLWESETVQLKPQASIRARVVRYKGGPPKLYLREEGIGFNKKPYNRVFLNRADEEMLGHILIVLKEGTDQLHQATIAYRESKGVVATEEE